MKKNFVIYNNAVHGNTISAYGSEHGYLDYRTLANVVGDMILNNNIMNVGDVYEWELENGNDRYFYDENGNEISENEYEDLIDDGKNADYGYYEVYQTYIISEYGADILKKYTNEIVYYNSNLDMYVWGITHFGTSWDYVLTDIKISDMETL